MTTITVNEAAADGPPQSPGLLKRAAAWPLNLLRALGEVYRRGLLLPLVAPAILAIVVLPEGVQHVVEIKLGMFNSMDAFQTNAADSTRMAFGYVKMAGFILCILAAARFAYCGTVRKTLLMPLRDLGRVAFGFVIGIITNLPAEWVLRTAQPPHIFWPITIVSWLVSSLLLVYLIGALLGDRQMIIRAAFTRGWKVLPPLVILTIAAYWPAARLHAYAHKLALGTEPALLWTIMAADALVVGLLAALIGSALTVSYRLGTGRSGRDGEVEHVAATAS